MNCFKNLANIVFAAMLFLSPIGIASSQALAQSPELDALFSELGDPSSTNWEDVEKQIWAIWSKSGSKPMDLLLARGREAMNKGDLKEAIQHLTALVDHAPEFAEGWNARATAFFLSNQYGLSVADIETTLSLNPRHFGALTGLGMILEQTGDSEAALRVFRQAETVHPKRPSIKTAIERLEEKAGGKSL